MPNTIEGLHSARRRYFAIVASRFNEKVTKRLLDGAFECLRQHGVSEARVDIVRCPGSFEIPQTARRLADSGRYDAIICLGCVIRGETPHFQYIASAAAGGVEAAARQTGVPMSFGVLTTDNLEQAMARAGAKTDNKGWEAALSAIEMADLFARIGKRKRK